MKSKLLILLLFIASIAEAQWVPNTTTFTLQDVCNAVGGDDLQEAFSLANSTYFDPAYSGSKNSLLNFRNYGPGVGDVWGGGLVAYFSEDGGAVRHGFICGSITPHLSWNGSNGNVVTYATATQYGHGGANTLLIVNANGTGSYLAKYCDSSTEGGYTDWVMPSYSEVACIYTSREALGIGGISIAVSSSSETSQTQYWRLNFTGPVWWQEYKFASTNVYTIPIRYF